MELAEMVELLKPQAVADAMPSDANLEWQTIHTALEESVFLNDLLPALYATECRSGS